jgi:hypothetical protein
VERLPHPICVRLTRCWLTWNLGRRRWLHNTIIIFPQNIFLSVIVVLPLPDFPCRFFVQHFSTKNLLVIQRHLVHLFPYLPVRTLSVGGRHIQRRLQTQ